MFGESVFDELIEMAGCCSPWREFTPAAKKSRNKAKASPAAIMKPITELQSTDDMPIPSSKQLDKQGSDHHIPVHHKK